MGAAPANAQNSCAVFSIRGSLSILWFIRVTVSRYSLVFPVFLILIIITRRQQCRANGSLCVGAATQGFAYFDSAQHLNQPFEVGMDIPGNAFGVTGKVRGGTGPFAEREPGQRLNFAAQARR